MDNNKKGVLLDKEELDEGGVQKEGMQKESMSKEGMQKEGMQKESMPKEGMQKESIPKEGMQKEGMPQGYGRRDCDPNAGMPPYYAQGNRGQYADMPPGHGRTGQGHNMAPAYGYGGPGRNMHGVGGPMQEPGRPGYCYDRNTYPYPGQGDYGQEPEVPLTVGEWLFNMLLMLIPCVNIILMLVWAFGDKEKRSKSNYYRARLIFWGILIGILFLWTCLYGMLSWLL